MKKQNVLIYFQNRPKLILFKEVLPEARPCLISHVTSKKTKFVLKPLPYQSNNKSGEKIHNIAL